jgi:hypothetical protein
MKSTAGFDGRGREGCDKSEWRGSEAPQWAIQWDSATLEGNVCIEVGSGVGGESGGGGLQRIRPGIYRYFLLLSTWVGSNLPQLPSERSNGVGRPKWILSRTSITISFYSHGAGERKECIWSSQEIQSM